MLQGVCEIELRDEKGVVVQKTKDKNMFTNAISNVINADFTKINRLLGSDYSTNNLLRFSPILSKAIGGIYLFNEVQDENTDNIIPNFSKLTGCASMSKSVIDNTYSGLLNINESSIIYNDHADVIGVKFVFDFPTDRSNGTIKSVSLCSDAGARYLNKYVGYTKFNYTYPLNLIDPIKQIASKNESDASVSFENNTDSMGSIITMIDNGEIIFLDTIDFSSKTIVLRKYKIRDSIGLNEKFISSSSGYINKDIMDIVKESIIDVSDVIITYNNLSYWQYSVKSSVFYYDGYIYIANAYKDKIKLKKIDIDNLNVVETVNKSFEQGHLNDGYYHGWNMSNYGTYNSICVYKNYYIVPRSVKEDDYQSILFLDKNSLSIIKEIKFNNNANEYYYGLEHPLVFGYMGDYLVLQFGYMDETKTKNTYRYFVDADLNFFENKIGEDPKTVYMICQQTMFKYPIVMYKRQSFGAHWNPSSTYYGLALSLYPKFTIDNLATPVTKTASQTMKVIYTIKDAE